MGDIFAFIHAALPWVAIGLFLAVLAVRNSHREKEKDKSGDYGTEGMCLGMCLGTALGTAFGNNTVLGISLGMLICLAVFTSIKKDSDDNNDGAI